MAEMRGSAVICDDRCGCPSPCPGGLACKCRSSSGPAGGGMMEEHKQCACGEHCGCNPCTCSKSSNITGRGKAFCKCSNDCTCVTCSS